MTAVEQLVIFIIFKRRGEIKYVESVCDIF
jgi:hypothetical protein